MREAYSGDGRALARASFRQVSLVIFLLLGSLFAVSIEVGASGALIWLLPLALILEVVLAVVEVSRFGFTGHVGRRSASMLPSWRPALKMMLGSLAALVMASFGIAVAPRIAGLIFWIVVVMSWMLGISALWHIVLCRNPSAGKDSKPAG